jgi:putative phytanoyl-coA dioxygenase
VAPEDLIEEVANFCREAQLDCFKNNFSERELEFANILRNKILNLPNGDIYGTNIWAELKIDAEKFLNILGYQIKDFDYSTIDNIDRNELGK